MAEHRNSHCGNVFLGIVFGMSVLVSSGLAQTLGNNAIFNANNNVVQSPAFIDAVGYGVKPDVCQTIQSILANPLYPSSGTIVDARGVVGLTSMTCAASPWTGSAIGKKATILLPAGTIVIPGTWVLPPNTRLIGQGDSINSSTSSTGTTIQVCTTINTCQKAFSGTDILDLGNSSVCPSNICTGISVENLVLDGQGQNGLNGIVNKFSQDRTYVDHVGIYQVIGTGLLVSYSGASGSGNLSGPYTNITFNTGAWTTSVGTACASILGSASVPVATKGIRDLTCLSNATPDAAVLLDASNNSIRDLGVNGFRDGIQIGNNADAHANVLTNIHNAGTFQSRYLIHICSPNHPSNGQACANTNHSVSDLVIMGAVAPPYNCPTGSPCVDADATIDDDVTSSFLSTIQGDNAISMYVLGESANPSNGGYTRYTTSPNVPSWGFWTSSSSPTGTACSPGSLLSNVNSGASPTFYVCKANAQWASVN